MTALTVPLLPVQYQFMTCEAKFSALVTGVGYGKSWCGAHRGASMAMAFPGTQGLAAANSYRQLEDVVVPFLEEALTTLGMPFVFQKGKSRFILANGSKILCRSLDRTAIAKLRGTAFVWAWLDEARDMPEEAFTVVQSRVGRARGPAARVFITTTPNGFNWIYKRFGPNRTNKVDYAVFHASTRDNPALQESFDSDLRDSYDENLAAQELDGEFRSAESTLYYPFDLKGNVDRRARYRPDLPLALALDFNVNPCVGVLIQEISLRTCVVDEIWCDTGEGTPGVIDLYLEGYRNHPDLTIYGDPAGHGRGTTTGKSDYELWKEALPGAQIVVPRRYYPVVDRVNSVNTRLLHPRTKKRGVKINPKCSRLIEDLSQVLPMKDGSRAPRKGAGVAHELTHISDAFGYYVVHEHSVRAKVDARRKAEEDARHFRGRAR